MTIKTIGWRIWLLALPLALAGCGLFGSDEDAIGATAPAPSATAYYQPSDPPPPGSLMQCVPYARAVSGIQIRGDAWSWWETAAGTFDRGSAPALGAVLVLAKTDRLRAGHLSVVAALVDRRRILVDHANWFNDEAIVTGMTVVDVSAANDWTELRFWNPRTGSWGNVYRAYGFIYRPGTAISARGMAPARPFADG